MSLRDVWLGADTLGALLLLLVAGCGQSSNRVADASATTAASQTDGGVGVGGGVDSGTPAVDPNAPWELFHERRSGSPPFDTNRYYIKSSGEVVAVELCDEHVTHCSLGLPGAMPSEATRVNCRGDKRPLLRGRALPSALASLGEVLRSPEFNALADRYVVEAYDVGNFTLRVHVTGLPRKSIYYSPWPELEKVPAGAQVANEMAKLLSALESTKGECVDEKTAEAAIPRNAAD